MSRRPRRSASSSASSLPTHREHVNFPSPPESPTASDAVSDTENPHNQRQFSPTLITDTSPKSSLSRSNNGSTASIRRGVPQKVRFPKDNNPNSHEVHLPTDDVTARSQPTSMPLALAPLSSSPLPWQTSPKMEWCGAAQQGRLIATVDRPDQRRRGGAGDGSELTSSSSPSSSSSSLDSEYGGEDDDGVLEMRPARRVFKDKGRAAQELGADLNIKFAPPQQAFPPTSASPASSFSSLSTIHSSSASLYSYPLPPELQFLLSIDTYKYLHMSDQRTPPISRDGSWQNLLSHASSAANGRMAAGAGPGPASGGNPTPGHTSFLLPSGPSSTSLYAPIRPTSLLNVMDATSENQDPFSDPEEDADAGRPGSSRAASATGTPSMPASAHIPRSNNSDSAMLASTGIGSRFFDIGLITPGGLAPGTAAGGMDGAGPGDARVPRSRQDPIERNDLESLGFSTTSLSAGNQHHARVASGANSSFNTNATNSPLLAPRDGPVDDHLEDRFDEKHPGGYPGRLQIWKLPKALTWGSKKKEPSEQQPMAGGDAGSHDIPLLELHSRLSQLASQKKKNVSFTDSTNPFTDPAAGGSSNATPEMTTEFAKSLVRAHSKHLHSGPGAGSSTNPADAPYAPAFISRPGSPNGYILAKSSRDSSLIAIPTTALFDDEKYHLAFNAARPADAAESANVENTTQNTNANKVIGNPQRPKLAHRPYSASQVTMNEPSTSGPSSNPVQPARTGTNDALSFEVRQPVFRPAENGAATSSAPPAGSSAATSAPAPSDNASSETIQEDQTVDRDEDYIPPPQHVRQGVLGSLLKLYNQQQQTGEYSDSNTTPDSVTPGPGTGAVTPTGAMTPTAGHARLPLLKAGSGSYENVQSAAGKEKQSGKLHKKKWSLGFKSANASTSSLGELIISSNNLLIPGSAKNSRSSLEGVFSKSPSGASSPPQQGAPARPKYGRQHSALEAIRKAQAERKRRKQYEVEEMRITLHIADVLQRQRFILRLCRALMLYGAPTHRLEEYMTMTSRALAIDGQYIYIPGCMIASFGDSTTHTSEMQLVRVVQGVNLSKLQAVHHVYKEVLHAKIRVETASRQIDALLKAPNRYPKWLVILIFALASACVGPFGFGATWIDMPICFFLGGIVGLLQIVVAPRSGLYNNVFEVTACVVVSFLGRAFGSIGTGDDRLFCFSALVQSSLALILPGYIICKFSLSFFLFSSFLTFLVCGALELQSRNIVAGSVRMFYAIIYSLLMSFGISLGAVIYGWIDSNASSVTTCPNQLDPLWRLLFVPLFTVGLALVNQASFGQLPVMVLVSGAGYAASYFSGKKLTNATELTSAVAALVIGILGNLHSRVGHGLAFAAMLPGIFVQVPSGVAVQGSLISGIVSANQIVSNSTSSNPEDNTGISLSSLSVGVAMIQISIGISVGLFLATLVVYPLGKKKSGLFTF